MFFLIIFIFFFLFELIIFFSLKKFKKNFQWLITEEDEFPVFDKIKFQRFKINSLDEKLGWRQKLEGSGFNNQKKKYSNFINNHRILLNKRKIKLISSFGDSYVYCNYTDDRFTWQEQISKKNNFNIVNYGVANYGLDQAILKYQNTKLSKKTKFVIMGFVPETIVRIQTRWKHYVEFGNINGFKPRYYLKGKRLLLKKNPITKRTNIKNLNSIIKNLRKEEIFYKKKFLKYKFSFPYSFSFIRNFFENFIIFYNLFLKDLCILTDSKKSISKIDDKLFNIIIKRNIKAAHLLYNDDNSVNLLSQLIFKFRSIAQRRKHIPIIIIFPQPDDLKLKSFSNVSSFTNLLDGKINFIDLSKFINKKNLNKYYMLDKYGGHFSKQGNKKVSKIISSYLKKII